MMKLLQINSCLGVQSTGRISEGIGDVARTKGWNTYIAHGARYVGTTKMQSYQIGSKCSEYLHYVKSLLLDSHGLGSRLATRRLVNQIKEIKPDIIHLHNIHGYYLNYEILFEYLAQSGIPVVWTLHDCWSFTGHCAHFVSVNCMKWKKQCFQCPLTQRYPKALVDNSIRNFKLKKSLIDKLQGQLTIVPVSAWLATQTEQSFFSHQRIEYIYNGIDVSSFSPQNTHNVISKYRLEGKTVLLGAATAWSEAKGFSDYIALRQKLSSNYVIIMVGLSEDKIEELPDGIIGIKRTQSVQELAELYSTADIVLSLSRAETFGLTVVEGMACGTPAIVYNNTAAPELITNTTGLIVENTGDIDGLVVAIKEIEQHGKKYYSEACRKRVEEYFDKDKCFLKYVDLYNKILYNK